MYFRNNGLRETCLNIVLKSIVSADTLIGNMFNVSKHCCTQNDSTVTLFNDHFEG